MDKLSKNKFLTGMGLLAGVAAVGFGILVVPKWTEAGSKAAAIKNNVGKITKELEDLPGDPNVKAWADHAELLKKRYAGTPTRGLQKQQTLDKNLGQWFDGIEDNSTLATFYTPYDDQRQKLEEELLEKGVLLGSPQENKDGVASELRQPGFNWVQRTDIVRADSIDDSMKAKEILQKRFNICRAIVNAVTTDVDKKVRPRRLLDVTFLEKFPYAAAQTGVVDPNAGKVYLIPIDYTRYAGYSGPGKGSFSEQALPLNGDKPVSTAEADASKPGDAAPAPASDDKKNQVPLGRTLTFGFAIVMDYQDVPALVRNLVTPSVEPDLNLSIVGLSVFVHTPNPAKKTETFRIPPAEEEQIQEKIRQLNSAAQPPQVHVYITCQVFDFNPAAVPSFIKP